ncbi:uncharacterized protein LOC142342583 isoform X1 [Convolutriloba macropyga]|uniref:uncharacterized protein LOC142342583 isoform X1 n=1 Tax=Convolutriloba macropyga TaxID=536237 RepID=UPI003F522512
MEDNFSERTKKRLSQAFNNNNNATGAGGVMQSGTGAGATNTGLLGQNASTMREVIRLFREKEEIEEELREAETLQVKLEEGLKDELESIDKEYEGKTTAVYREALDQVYSVSRDISDKKREDKLEQEHHLFHFPTVNKTVFISLTN